MIFLGLLFLLTKVVHILILQKMGWAAFWAIWSQTHLVALCAQLRDTDSGSGVAVAKWKCDDEINSRPWVRSPALATSH
jgi:hypothetical protein